MTAQTAHAILPIYKMARAEGIAHAQARAIALREYARITSTIARMREHAPGPWGVEFVDEHADGSGFAARPIYIHDRRGHIVAAVSDDAPMSEANATAARIIECVNALEGVADPVAYLARLRSYAAMLERETAPRRL